MGSSDQIDNARDSHPLEIEETAMLGDDTAFEAKRRARLPGETFGRYRIQKTLGEGAMGSVYLAHDTQLGRKVALKIPKVNAEEDAKFLERFLREARSAATLSHPNICPVYDVGEIDETHFITMAYIQGHPLSDFVNPEKPQLERNVANIIRKIALALHEAHGHGLVHRDVKPANIMVDQRNEPIIMDFGLARHVDDGEDARLTKDGTILGSPAYMSPEQIEGNAGKIGPPCDIYSLGVIAYELLTGQLPFQGSIASIIGQIVSKPAEDPLKLRPDLSPRLAAICQRAIAKQIEERYATMKAFAADLTDFLKQKPEENKAATRRDESTKTGMDTVFGLKLTAKPIEAVCRCGQKLSAKRHLAGKMTKCPRCGDVLQLPHAGETDAEGKTGAESTQRVAPQLAVSCGQCGQRFMARANLAGKAVKCPVCSHPLVVPGGSGRKSSQQILVRCGCGQQFLAAHNLAGKRVKCTSCGRPLTIPG